MMNTHTKVPAFSLHLLCIYLFLSIYLSMLHYNTRQCCYLLLLLQRLPIDSLMSVKQVKEKGSFVLLQSPHSHSVVHTATFFLFHILSFSNLSVRTHTGTHQTPPLCLITQPPSLPPSCAYFFSFVIQISFLDITPVNLLLLLAKLMNISLTSKGRNQRGEHLNNC